MPKIIKVIAKYAILVRPWLRVWPVLSAVIIQSANLYFWIAQEKGVGHLPFDFFDLVSKMVGKLQHL